MIQQLQNTQESALQIVTSEWAALLKEAPQVAEAITKIETLAATLPAYEEKQKAISVCNTTADYAALGEVLTQLRALKDQGEAYLSPYEVLVSRVSTFLKTARLRLTNQAKIIEDMILPKLKAWEKKVDEEKAAVAAEQAKLDKKAEKTGEPAGKVQPNIRTTSVAGYRRSVRYWVEVEDRDKFLRTYRSAPKDFDKYITVNVQQLSNDWRECKDPEDKTMKQLAKAGLKLCKD